MDVLKWRKQIHHDLYDKLLFDHQELAKYCQSYGLDQLNCRIEILKIEGHDQKKNWVAWNFCQLQKPVNEYALVTHGLFDHSAYMRPFIEKFLSLGLNVLALELPGHGLDFRLGLECKNFDEYTELNQKAHEWIKSRGAFVSLEVAHSTGAVGRLNRLLDGEKCGHKIVFLNPLVKIQMFKLAKMSYQTFFSFLPSIPRKKWGRGEDPEFLSFRAQDPLQPWRIPIKWIQHYLDWVEKIKKSDVEYSGDELLVLIGGKDRVVNGQESVHELRTHFKNFESSYHPNLGHQMLYGDEREVQDLMEEINRWWRGVDERRNS